MPSAVYSSYHGPPSSNGSDQATRQMQFGQDAEYAARKQTMLRHEYERMQNEQAARAQLQHEIHESKFQIDKLRSTLTGIGREGGPVAKMQEDYRTYRGIMEEREEAYRQLWRQEEDRVKNVSEDTKTRLKIVRDHLIGTLDQVDVSNRSMLDAMDELMKVDVDMCREHGDPIPHEMSSFAANAAPVMGQGVSMVNVAPVMGQGVSMMGLDLKSSRGSLVAPGQGQGVSMLGLDLGKKGEMPGSPQQGGVVVTADVIQPVTNMAGMASDKEVFRQQLIDAGFVRASQVLAAFPATFPFKMNLLSGSISDMTYFHRTFRTLPKVVFERCETPGEVASSCAMWYKISNSENTPDALRSPASATSQEEGPRWWGGDDGPAAASTRVQLIAVISQVHTLIFAQERFA